jgi:ubiquinone/menaquinone biosynthesis C-methylase UbiE
MTSSETPWYLQGSIVKSYESWYEGKGQRADLLEKQLLKELVEYVANVRTMLEVGVGTGHFARWFESLGIQCVGLDFSLLMLKEAKRMGKGDLIRGDAHHLPFREKTFDVATYITCMEYMRSPTEVLQEARRVARNGIIWGIMNKWSLPTLRRKLQVALGKNPFYSNARFYSIRDGRNFLTKALDGANYSIEWWTTVFPRILLVKESKLPFGAFLGVAVKFNSEGN